MKAFFVTIPHAGESVPKEAIWLQNLPEAVLMRDVDRYVDQLYQPGLEQLKIPHIVAKCHRYVIDLNRKPDEYDQDSVQGASFPSGSHPKGLHWSITTFGEKLIIQPMPLTLHEQFVQDYYTSFHQKLQNLAQSFSSSDLYHLDLHSMPSKGTAMHNDPGDKRADVVVSDFHGKSARKDFVDIVIESYKLMGFRVSYNWPYFGGGITQMYGRPEKGHHTVQVELNRALYMDEETKQKSSQFLEIQKKLSAALINIYQALPT